MATREVVWLERVQVGQKIEILVPTLCQFILSPCTNNILFSSFSIDKITLFDFCRPFRLL